jgi:hypothetical protein
MMKRVTKADSLKVLEKQVLSLSLVSTSMLILLGGLAVFGYGSSMPPAMPFLLAILCIWMSYYHVRSLHKRDGKYLP